MKILITAGPTREYLDPVRFFTNGSSGQMGYACAESAVKMGHQVTLISGPVSLDRPKGLKFIQVTSAADMAAQVLEVYPKIDCVIMTAAVADYTPANYFNHKIVKSDNGMQIEMKRTMDILAELGRLKQSQKLIGFAVQDKKARFNAKRKLLEKNLDAIILNAPSAMGSKRNDIKILRKGNLKQWESITDKTKKYIGKQIIKLAEEIVNV